jgi:hypothetical protein
MYWGIAVSAEVLNSEFSSVSKFFRSLSFYKVLLKHYFGKMHHEHVLKRVHIIAQQIV